MKELINVNFVKSDHLLAILNQVNHNIQFTMKKESRKTTFFGYNDKQKLYKDLQQTNRSKAICLIYIKPPTALLNKYTVLSCNKNMYHCCE